ncbi:MAG: aminoglycoside phosphotransferase [Sphingobium sp.]|uniref:aminoglycoside phosphotransferase family protein n=1 Tax=Sphingobium sp. TaxID=1912891 RepID=UPI000C41EE0E|nr:phosphotransferase [Sphingobium sp.]MBU0657534.1 phosphotransferase [Alphaproteobacteria bacterium]MBA4754538.1 phosphotransferase [Sphingobium sp.]MBS87271.1 aminoglycoside phosphotransferase [Sphingobium sp.]MBS87857.1 aminoglycoside phosphotransferase [Sphingobium sp.]MBU0774848.1 phosphotransferase [Alphaproteobacteria bacterium]
MIPPAAAPAFLGQAGWGDAAIVPLAGDASFRRYFRVVDGGRRAVLMDAPPPHEDPRPFIAIAEHLLADGFAAPRILARDLEEGLVLIEDFGDLRVKEHLDDQPDAELAVYGRAIDLLADLHRLPAAPVPPYDRAVYQREVDLLTQWYCPAIGLTVDQDAYVAAWDAVLPIVEQSASPTVTVLRDYHAENIMLIDRATSHGLGLLDFQDALAGHPAYDLVSLLQDARRDVPPQIEAAMLARYKAIAAPPPDFHAAYAVLGAQRNAKIIGIFTRLWQRDGKPRYLSFLPRMWDLLERDLAHPALEPVAQWFAANIPADQRHRALVEFAPA